MRMSKAAQHYWTSFYWRIACYCFSQCLAGFTQATAQATSDKKLHCRQPDVLRFACQLASLAGANYSSATSASP